MAFQYKKTKHNAPEGGDEELAKSLYLWATSRCSQRECCRSELAQKMRTKGATTQQIEQILEQLEAERYVDEIRYARAFVSDKFRFERWGRVKIRYALQHKGIASYCIDEALSHITSDEYKDALATFIAQRKKATKGDTSYEINQKVARVAISRGFEPQLVFSQLKLDDDEW